MDFQCFLFLTHRLGLARGHSKLSHNNHVLIVFQIFVSATVKNPNNVDYLTKPENLLSQLITTPVSIIEKQYLGQYSFKSILRRLRIRLTERLQNWTWFGQMDRWTGLDEKSWLNAGYHFGVVRELVLKYLLFLIPLYSLHIDSDTSRPPVHIESTFRFRPKDFHPSLSRLYNL